MKCTVIDSEKAEIKEVKLTIDEMLACPGVYSAGLSRSKVIVIDKNAALFVNPYGKVEGLNRAAWSYGMTRFIKVDEVISIKFEGRQTL